MTQPSTLAPSLVLLAVAAYATACGDGATEPPAPTPDPPRASTLTVTPATARLTALGETVRLVAEVRDQNGEAMAGATVTWSSSATAVATVDASGLVTGVAEGMAEITAAAGEVSGKSEITVENPDRAALVALYNATDGPNWVNSENWLTDAPLGGWYGVNTNTSGRVVGLDLGGQRDEDSRQWIRHGLTGPIPPELGNLTELTALNLHQNALEGPIPPELGNLPNLERLYLYDNDLEGPIPPELGNLTSLVDLFLHNNNFTGAIPSELGNLSRLWSLYLSGNPLSGPIPVEFARLQRLTNVFLPGGVCVPDELLEWAADRSVSALPCNSGGRLLPSVLMREDGNGLSLALPDDLREPSALTVSDSGVVAVSVADGWLELVPRGRGTAEVEVVPTGRGDPAHARVVVRAAVGSFGIDIVMERPAPVTYESALIVAADWWSGLLDGTEWPDRRPTCFNDRATAIADEVLIHARIDPDASVAGYAHSCFRDSGLQVTLDPGGGRITANPSNANPFLVQHEMGHLLGLVLWRPDTGLVTANRTYFVGTGAVEAFRARGGDASLPGVPISGVHWGSGVRDFMAAAPGINDGSQVVISAAALADAGYTVDMTKAKPIKP